MKPLDRYGIEWTGPHTPISVPMPDGYWTPYHLAEERIEQAEDARRVAEQRAVALQQECARLVSALKEAETRIAKLDGDVRKAMAKANAARASNTVTVAIPTSVGDWDYDAYWDMWRNLEAEREDIERHEKYEDKQSRD